MLPNDPAQPLSGSAAPVNVEVEPLLDINGNPILPQWSDAAAPAPADAEPLKTESLPAAGRRGMVPRTSAATFPETHLPPARPVPDSGPLQSQNMMSDLAMSDLAMSDLAMSDLAGARYDLAGNPMTSARASRPANSPNSSSVRSRYGGQAIWSGKSGSNSSMLGIMIALIVVALIGGGGCYLYMRNQAAARPPAKLAAAAHSGSSSHSSSSTKAAGSKKAGAKHHSAP